ncbi:RNA editing complex protein MP18 [Trypanosoma grayi]|uniref:RNA editing complex protein MP18 n=1 Tax=Trypanosoma grayi TaxID=71804 RepID=UPI0004F452DB|nr:RNA editing complex protein MP18 [Trypanosoma grayi]KEG06579.1 RNA editing complex protein MP18 [Trypanosoma grayi]
MLRRTVLNRCKSVNSVTLVGVVHDIQNGFVYEDAVTQFTLTTTSIDTTHPTQEVVVEKDHHTIRCFGELFSAEVKHKIKEGNVVCVNGRLRLSPQLEPSCNKYFYFPYIQVQPPHGQVAVIHGDRRTTPAPVNPTADEISSEGENGTSSSSSSSK